jgi:hypothetical protein
MKTLIAFFSVFSMFLIACVPTGQLGEETYRPLEEGGVSVVMDWRERTINEIEQPVPLKGDKGTELPLYTAKVTWDQKVEGKVRQQKAIIIADSGSKFVRELLILQDEEKKIKGLRQMRYALPNEANIKEWLLQDYIQMMNASGQEPSKQQIKEFLNEANTFLEKNYIVIREFVPVKKKEQAGPNRHNLSSSYIPDEDP